MSFMFYEVWAINDDGHEELVGTTASKSEAMKMASEFLKSNEQYLESWVSEENSEGDMIEISRLTVTEDGSIINV